MDRLVVSNGKLYKLFKLPAKHFTLDDTSIRRYHYAGKVAYEFLSNIFSFCIMFTCYDHINICKLSKQMFMK